jgi:hypothetical protein
MPRPTQGRPCSNRPLLSSSQALLALCAAGAAAVALAFAAACSDFGTVLVPTDAAAEASTADTSALSDSGTDAAADVIEELQVADVCGPGPWVNLGIVVVAFNVFDPDGSLLPGAQFTSPLCPGLVKVSDNVGVIEGQISKDVPFYGRLQATGYISELAPEEVFDADSLGNKVEMLPTLVESFVGLDGGGKNIAILAEKTADDAGACSTLDGITFSVPGHPEAQVLYLSSASIPMPIPGGTQTSTRGLAVISGLDAGQFVTLAGTKTYDGGACTIVFQRGPLTGRVPLENGFVSLMPAYVTP